MLTDNKKIVKINIVIANVVFIMAMFLFLAFLFVGNKVKGSERYPSKLDYIDISSGWTVSDAESVLGQYDFPTKIDIEAGQAITTSKELNYEIADGDYLMLWNKGQNLIISIDGKVRQEYGKDTIKAIGKDIPYLYVLAPLYKSDMGKEIKITYYTDNAKDSGIIGTVFLGDKTSLLLSVIINYQVEVVAAFVLVLLGIICVPGSIVISVYKKQSESLWYLGCGVMLAGLWIVLNSQLRQFVFPNVSVTRNCAFLVVAILPFPFSLYLDQIQELRYHLGYFIVEMGSGLNFILLFALNLARYRGLSEMFYTTPAILLIAVVWGLITLTLDIIRGHAKKYSLVATGLVFFGLSAIFQMIVYLTNTSGILSGSFIVAGLLLLLACSIVYAIRRMGDVYTGKEEAVKEADNIKVAAMESLAKTVDAKDKYTKGHSERVAKYSKEIAKRMGYSRKEQRNIYYVGLLHDVGKIGIPDSIINKPDKLTKEEFDVIKTHPVIGSDILDNIKIISNIEIGARWHHERYDGGGYPDGLKGEDIPQIARIIGVADAYDAMSSNRSYRTALDQNIIREEILKNKGRQFDPEIAQIMLQMIDEDKKYTMREEPPKDTAEDKSGE